jgi:hypothetical protein
MIVERGITSSILLSLSFLFILSNSLVDYLHELFAFYENVGFIFFNSNIFLLRLYPEKDYYTSSFILKLDFRLNDSS